MMLPDYWLQRPNMEIDFRDTVMISTNCLPGSRLRGINTWIDYTFAGTPKWQFLCYLADQHGCCLAWHRRAAYPGL